MIWQFFVGGEPQPYPKKTSSYRMGGKIFFVDKTGAKRGWMDEVKIRAWMALSKPERPVIDPELPVRVIYVFWVTRPKSKPAGRIIKAIIDGIKVLFQKFTFPVCRPDLDNYGYGVTNALTGVVWPDDSQIVDEFLFKRYADDNNPAGVRVRVEVLTSLAVTEPIESIVQSALSL